MNTFFMRKTVVGGQGASVGHTTHIHTPSDRWEAVRIESEAIKAIPWLRRVLAPITGLAMVGCYRDLDPQVQPTW